MSGGEKKWVIKKICWQRVVENWDKCTKKKKFNNIFITFITSFKF